jgi:hypothetical protein
MSIKTTKDIIDYIYKIHQRIGQYYSDLYNQSKKQKVKILLNYLQMEEKKVLKNINEFRNDCPKAIMKTWYQVVPELELNNCRDELKLNHELEFMEVIDIIKKFHECLRKFYKRMMDFSVSLRTKELFNNLFQMEKQYEKDFTNNVVELQLS